MNEGAIFIKSWNEERIEEKMRVLFSHKLKGRSKARKNEIAGEGFEPSIFGL